MNITGDIEFCVMCENPDTRLESDDFDFCKKCQLEEARSYIKALNSYGEALSKVIKRHNLLAEVQQEILSTVK